MRSNGWVREIRGGRLVGLTAVALTLLAVTAVASREPLSALGKAGRAAGSGIQVDTSPWEFALIAAGGLIAFICLLIYGGFSRRTTIEGLQRLLGRLAVFLITLTAGILIAGALAGTHRRAALQNHPSGPVTAMRPVSPRPAAFTVPVWVTWGIVGALVAGALLFVVGAKARARPKGQQTLPSAMESAVTAALVDLDTIADPRLAIIAAYRRMEASLAEAGFPRAAPEAPREYLGRVAGALEIDPKPLGTLTTLFEAAKFSLRRLDATARQRAITALHALQAELA